MSRIIIIKACAGENQDDDKIAPLPVTVSANWGCSFWGYFFLKGKQSTGHTTWQRFTPFHFSVSVRYTAI